MRSPNDPIRTLRNRLRVLLIAGLVAILACAAWALRPLTSAEVVRLPETTIPVTNEMNVVADEGFVSIDPRVFAIANLWNPPPPPPALESEAVAQAEPQKPLRVQLIGIIRDGPSLRAAIYDMDQDRILIVESGDTIGDGHKVTSITPGTVELTDGRSTRQLHLKEERGL